MSDQHWQAPDSPAASEPGPEAAPPAPGPYAPPPPVAPQGWAPPAAPGWTPPPKPGLLPLRPLDFGTLLWAPFRTLRRNPAAVFGSGLVVQMTVAIVSIAVMVPFMLFVFSRLTALANGADQLTPQDDAVLTGTFAGFALLLLVPAALGVVAGAFLQGVMVVEVATGTLGEKLSFGALWRRAAKRIWPLIGWTLLGAAAMFAAMLVLVLCVVIGAMAGPVGVGVGFLLAILVGIGLVVVGAWLFVKLSLVPSAIVLEQAGVGRAIARSWRLTDGYYWRTFGIEILVTIILWFASQIVTQPIGLIGGLVTPILDPTRTTLTSPNGGPPTGFIVIMVISALVSGIVGSVTAVVQAALIAVIYIDLRMRKEGLDLTLQRHVESDAADDPYLASAPEAPAGAPYSAPTGA